MRRLTPEEKEWKKLLKKEEEYLNKRKEKKESGFSSFLEEKIPIVLQLSVFLLVFSSLSLQNLP